MHREDVMLGCEGAGLTLLSPDPLETLDYRLAWSELADPVECRRPPKQAGRKIHLARAPNRAGLLPLDRASE